MCHQWYSSFLGKSWCTPQLTLQIIKPPVNAKAAWLTTIIKHHPLLQQNFSWLLAETIITATQRPVGWLLIGAVIAHQPSETSQVAYGQELLLAALQCSFFLLDYPQTQLLWQTPDNPLLQAYYSSSWSGLLISKSSVWWQRSECQAHWQTISSVPVQAAVVVWMHMDGAILLVQSAAQPAMTPWELPGGKLEAKENPKQALVRELWEELAVTVEPAQLIALGSTPMGWAPQQPMVHFYLWQNDQQLPQPQEQQRMIWVSPEQISHYPMQVIHAIAYHQLIKCLSHYSPHWLAYAQQDSEAEQMISAECCTYCVNPATLSHC